MSWREEYSRKLVSAEEAVSIVESGDRVIMPMTAQPHQLAKALAARGSELQGVRIAISAAEFELDGFLSAAEGAFQVEIECFMSAVERPFHDEGKVTYLPLPFSLSFKAVDRRPE